MSVTRFAPSPTGFLHLGHAFSACSALGAVRGGRFLLRIEDIDRQRCKPHFEVAILEDLRWLGLTWEEPPRRQSEHMEEYADALAKLAQRGLAYRCFRTRAEVLADIARAPHGRGEGAAFRGGPLSPEEEHDRLLRGEPYAWRLSLDRCRDTLGAAYARLSFVESGQGPNGERGPIRAQPDLLGDVVLARKDFPASYHLAAVHDDALQGIDLVVRGEDLFHATHAHVLLQALNGWPTPDYRHHRLLLDEHGKRFAKRNQAVTLRALREQGASPAEVRAMIGL